MSGTLADTLHRLRIESLIQQAHAIHDWVDRDDRREQARQMIRAVMLDFSLGKISTHEREKLLGILRFAQEPCRVRREEPIPTFQDEQVVDRRDESPKKQLLLPFHP